jgi:rhomboid family GlyGly-CTERM serine protease
MQFLKILRHWWIPCSITIAALAVWAGGESLGEALRYERALVLDGEIYRLFSAHFVHVDGTHLATNLIGLALIWALVGREARASRWVIGFLASAMSVGLGLFIMAPEIQWYVGLSGVLHGLVVAGACQALWHHRFLLGLVMVKLVWEQFYPSAGNYAFGIPVIIDAHLFGALGGLLAAGLMKMLPVTAKANDLLPS